MGVINITPDSFSDGGLYLDHPTLSTHLLSCLAAEAIFDIGAESTAPGAAKVTADEEWQRWETSFFPVWEKLVGAHALLLKQVVSIDSYHVPTVSKVISKLRKLGHTGGILWNDISGKFDEEVSAMLEEHAFLKYVFCYNQAPTREAAQDHLGHLYGQEAKEREYFLHMVNYFHHAIIKASKIKAVDRLILDPTFGFSKTRAQNFRLWKMLPEIVEEVAHPHWLVGVSRKSFLRPAGKRITEPGVREQSEWCEALLLGDLLGQFQHQGVVKSLIIRHHRLDFLKTIMDFQQEKFKV
jgi:dihydropteroate synthase